MNARRPPGSTPTKGGGIKKVLYTLQSVRRIGVQKAAKALRANNACKACGLGMGGQHGGMTNELDEFPSICNKSVQAQLSDTQPAIPEAIFQHSLAELDELDGHELEALGRLNTPIVKAAGDNRYRPISWAEALDLTVQRFQQTRAERSFFYSSGRSSNEAGFVLQLFARAWGTNNVNNCSYYCHQATSVGLQQTVGTGTATVELSDLGGCDLIFVIGANPASNHPRFIHQLKACRERGGNVIVINPAREPGLVRFAVPKDPGSLLFGGTEIASHYLQPRIGSDIAVLTGLAKAVLAAGAHDDGFVRAHTEGFEAYLAAVTAQSWPAITESCGLERATLEQVASIYGKARHAVFAWGMGVTHHQHGVENVEAIANLALLRGMVGKRYAGLLPLRGHSNVQGIGTIGVKPVLPETVFAAIEETYGVSLPQRVGMDTMQCLEAAHGEAIDLALLMGGNLLEATPSTAWARQAFERMPVRVALTTTLNRSHLVVGQNHDSLVLPVAARDEEPQPTTQESMFNFVRLSDGGIARQNNARSEVGVLCAIAERVLPASPIPFSAFTVHTKVREAIAATVPGMEALAEIDSAKREFHVRQRLLHTPTFQTETGKARFVPSPPPTVAHPSGRTPHSFLLATVRSEGQFNTIVYETNDSYRQVPDRWSILINPDAMEALGLTAGDHVDVRSSHGTMKAVRVFPFDLPDGNALAYFPEANVLVGTDVDPRSRTPAFKAVAIQLSLSC